MERATTFFGNLGEFLANAARWIIIFGRKYPLAAAAYLVVCVFGFFNYVNQSAPPPPPPLAQSSTPADTAIAPPPPPAPVVALAQAQAFRNGNSVIIRWSQPVSKPSLYTDGNSLQANCQPQVCTAAIPEQISQVEAAWQEGGQAFKKKFRF